MSTLRRWLSRILGSFAHERADQELNEELHAHLQLEIDDLVRRGMAPAEARRAALIRSGGIDTAREAHRAQRGLPFIDHFLRDLHFAGRMMRRSAGFTAVAVLSLALAIAANTAVFSLTDAVFLTKLPVQDPDRLVLVEWTGPDEAAGSDAGFWRGYDGSIRRSKEAGRVIGTSFSVPLFEMARATSRTLSGLFAFVEIEQLNVVDAGGADIARGQLASGEYFTTLGVPAVRGRTFTREDERPDAEPVGVLSFRYWQRRFGEDPAVIGSVIRLNGVQTRIIGVTPPEFVGTVDVGQPADVTLPLALAPSFMPGVTNADMADAGSWWIQLMGRRAPDVTAEETQAELDVLFGSALRPAASGNVGGALRASVASGARGPYNARRDYALAVTLLSVLAGLVLLLACTNVASLLLTRASARRAEITMRLALGAGRRRVLSQLVTEAMLLAVMAEALGLGLAMWGKDLLLVLRPDTAALDLGLDSRAFMVATLLAVSTALLFGLVPGLYATRGRLAESMKAAQRSTRGRRAPFRGALMAGQIAISVALIFGSTLFLGTLRNLRTVDAGFDQDELLLFRVDPRLSQYQGDQVPSLYRSLQEGYAAIPNVEAVSFSRHGLLNGGRRTSRITLADQPDAPSPVVLMGLVGPGYFETMSIGLVRGRRVTAQDDERAPFVAVVNQAFARTMMPNVDPLGRRLTVSGQDWEIVGIVADARYYSIREPVEPTVYLPFLQAERGQAGFVLRSSTDPAALASAIREVTRSVDPTLSLFDITTQRDAAAASLGEEPVLATLTTAFAGLALFLAAIGVYAVMSQATSQRTGEIGVRLAMGARARNILWLIARPTIGIVCVGTAVGLAGALVGSRYFSTLLFGLTATDPRVIVLSVVVIASAAFVAAYAPANRARRISALEALRHE